MKIFHDDAHRLHAPRGELHGGELVEPFERPSRIDCILEWLKRRGFSDPVLPGSPDPGPVQAVHDSDYLAFLENAWHDWQREGFAGDLIPSTFPVRRMPGQTCPVSIDGRAGYYALAAETSITAGTWTAAMASCASAQAAQRHVVSSGARAAFALCRPPGHHAMKDMFGGYCFLNNAAIAAQMFVDDGAAGVAILDMDFHHGNGTQDIFYDRPDVLFASLHGDPVHAFPYFSGHAGETGTGAGEGTNFNFPMGRGTRYDEWSLALGSAIGMIRKFGAEALVVSLGVDAFRKDPISFFQLDTGDFARCGGAIAGLQLPTVVVMEGGYAIDEIGINTASFLEGLTGRS